MIKKYKWIFIVGAVLIVAIAGFGVVRSQNQAADADVAERQTAVAFMGDLSESATASGQVAAQRAATLSLASSGVVAGIETAVGDSVAAGDLLVQLETGALERAVLSAQADIAIAQANLDNGLAGASASAIAAAQAQVDSAQARLDRAIAGPTAQEIAASEAAVRAAQANMWASSGSLSATNEVSESDILAAQANLDDALEAQKSARDTWIMVADCEENADGTHSCVPSDSDFMDTVTQNVAAADAQVALMQARLDGLSSPDSNSVAGSQAGLASATAQYQAAVARHEALLAGSTAATIASAEADLASAQSNLDTLLAGSTDTQLLILQTRLAQAQTGLAEAEKGLADATLLAPFAGVITAVYVNEGEVAAGQAVQIVDNANLEVVLSVDEIDVGTVAVGQVAVVTLETWPDVEIASVVTAIAPSAETTNSGLVAYNVHLSLQNYDLPVLVGMTANADLITAKRENVLLVANAALTADREAGTYTVNLIRTEADGTETITAVIVEIGLKDGKYTQIISGIVAGDELLIGELAAPVRRVGGRPR